ncbi:MAG: energy transducer TonB [Alphaproteobacteria bacterium]
MLHRISLSILGGAAVSVGLGFAMMGMIAGDFEAQEKVDDLVFDISLVIEEPLPPTEVRKPKALEAVETPPPPSSIDKAKSKRPTIAIEVPLGIPDFKPLPMDPTDFVIRVADRDPQPIVRIQPAMPPRAERSGHCQVRFDISAGGKPYNIMATQCTQSLFERPSVKSVQKWNYHPEIRDGIAVARSGLQTKISFHLNDERGDLIPE